MADVLLVVPNFNLIHASFFPVGLGYIAGVLKEKKTPARIVSLIYEKDISAFKARIKEWRPAVIGLSCVTSQLAFVKKIVQEIRAETKALIICGGIHPTLAPRETIDGIEGLDAIVRGEGEDALSDLVDCLDIGADYYGLRNFWFRNNSKLLQNSMRPAIENLDTLPFPDRESLDYQKIVDGEKGVARLLFSRGCPFDCSYCSNGALQSLYHNRYFRQRSPQKALEEVGIVLKRYKVRLLGFDDDIFTVNKEWFYDFVSAYKREFSFPFGCNVRPGTCDRDMFNLLKESGCRSVNIGIESGDAELRNNLLNRRISDAEIIKAFELAHRAGLKTLSYNVIGFPGETPQSFAKTVQLNARVMPNEPYIYTFYPYPGTQLERRLKENNYEIRRGITERTAASFDSEVFPSEDIGRLYREFVSLVHKACGPKDYILYKTKNTLLRIKNKAIRFLKSI